MNNREKYTNNNLKKNKPTKAIPIMNTIFAVLFLGLGIYCKITLDDFKTIYFVLFIILVILFPIASWYNSYFSKKQNTKKILNYEYETKEIVAYIKRLKQYKGLELNKERKLKITYELTDEIIDKSPHYDEEHCSVGLAKPDSIIITIGVSFAGLEFKGYNQEFVGICGVLPRSIWYKKKLIVPNAKKGKIKIESIGFKIEEKMVIQALKNQDTYYDNKTGWTLIGEKKSTSLDEVIEIMTNVYVVIRNEELISVWIKLESGLAI